MSKGIATLYKHYSYNRLGYAKSAASEFGVVTELISTVLSHMNTVNLIYYEGLCCFSRIAFITDFK